MLWMFLLLTLGAISYTIYLLIEFFRESGTLEVQELRLESEKETVEVEIMQNEEARDQAKSRIAEAETTVKELQAKADEVQGQIARKRKERERRGKYRVE
ncbi:MAG: hypothetical protein QGI83_08610 [Candidatus Latescibacteria bacterium]|jgi:peptidoglycan hydrolase CwlO-like protein|nr:hypothetical protein [Candidatus Latescibacterota bacterium]